MDVDQIIELCGGFQVHAIGFFFFQYAQSDFVFAIIQLPCVGSRGGQEKFWLLLF